MTQICVSSMEIVILKNNRDLVIFLFQFCIISHKINCFSDLHFLLKKKHIIHFVCNALLFITLPNLPLYCAP